MDGMGSVDTHVRENLDASGCLRALGFRGNGGYRHDQNSPNEIDKERMHIEKVEWGGWVVSTTRRGNVNYRIQYLYSR